MAELSTLARPYAKAAFEYADAENALQQWQSDLQLVAVVVGDESVTALLADPALTTDAQAEAFVGLFGDEISDSCKRYLRVLAENRRLNLAPEILALFAQFKAQKESSVDVEMVSALEVPEAIRERIAKALGERLQRDVAVSTRVDSSLLGGVLIRAGDLVIDGSVRGRLNKLAEALTN
jgi:F-type H+-transporting ATPase subunit delta